MSRDAAAYSTLIHEAMEFAASAHEGQLRKNREDRIPYFSHCAAVGRILEHAGFDEEVVAAGILHDTVEDGGVTLKALADRFGQRVADLVALVTEEDKSLPWETRKQRGLEKLERASSEGVAISCADKIHNLWSLILYHRSGGDPWRLVKRGREAQMERLEKIAVFFRDRFDHPLRGVFEEALETLKREC